MTADPTEPQDVPGEQPDLASSLARLVEELADVRQEVEEQQEQLATLVAEFGAVKAALLALQTPKEEPPKGHTILPPVVSYPREDPPWWLK
jgi:uncharacterized coiled-coil protein SlyX